MNKDRSFANRPKAVTQKSEKDCKVFKTISKYFSDKEWAKLGYSEKTTYVYMKRNYDTMTGLGNRKFWVQTSLRTHHYPLSPFICHGFFLGCNKCPMPALCAGRNPRATPFFSFLFLFLIKKVMHKKPKEKNDLDPVPVALGSEQAQKQQSPPGEDSISDKQIKKIPGKRYRAYILRERKNLVAYEEISDPEEED
uniref:KRAB-related domain-containing protein n=1 Tax=Suricata suricatta TaxID=37032 RepID=A0A673VMF4_SURSU